jgi:pyruvate-formate lyase-activating enzyme
LESCNDCAFCQNLSNQSFCLYNQKYTKEEYFQKLAEIKTDTISHNITAYIDILRHAFQRNLNMLNSETCIGDVIYNSKYVIDSFNCIHNEHVKYSVETNDTKN